MKRFRLPTKLALAIVPIGLVALATGAWLSWTSLEEARVEERASYAAQVAAQSMDALVAVSGERSAMLDAATGEDSGRLAAAQEASDRAIERLRESVRELVPRASGPASGIAGAIFNHSSLSQARLRDAREGDPLGEETQELFDEIGNRLITIASQSTLYFGDPGPAREGEGAVSLARASFASFQQEQLLTRFRADETLMTPEEFDQRFATLESTVVDWLANADDNSPTVRALGLARSQVPAEGEGLDAETFLFDRDEVLAASASEILDRVAGSANRAATTVRAEAGTIAAVVLGVLFVTVVLAIVLGRSTVRRVRSVTSAAQHVADVELPKLVDALSNPKGRLEGSVPGELEEAGPDEVGELARSFRSLHGTLVEVANRQMEILRRGVSEIFVTLARRNGSLVDRQLALVDELESRQEDPEILDGYYKLDHLATRMRRNAESLLVLAGSESPRMWSEPLDMGDVVRAALGEVDEYQRVDVLALEPARLQGRVVTDLAHLMSELLDNATQFSPPSERVRVTGLFDDEGYVITIADSGLGISEERMAEINRLVVDPPVLGLALEPTLGMYVVARLANRHGIAVRLVPGVPGTTVRITLPRTLLESAGEETPPEGVVDVRDRPVDEAPTPEPRSASIPPYAFRTGSHPPLESVPEADGKIRDPDEAEESASRPEEAAPRPEEVASRPEEVASRPEEVASRPEEVASRSDEPQPSSPSSPPSERADGRDDRSGPEAPTPATKDDEVGQKPAPLPADPEPPAPASPWPERPAPADDRDPADPATPVDRPALTEPATPADRHAPPEATPAPPRGEASTGPKQDRGRPSADDDRRKPTGPEHPVPSPETGSTRDLPRRPARAGTAEPRQRPAPPSGPAEQQPGPDLVGGDRRRDRRDTPRTGRPVDASGTRSASPPPEAPTTLPTRSPGSSFRGDVSEEGTASVSKRGAQGIRNALDGYRLGRDIASQPPREPGESGPDGDDRGGEG